MNNQRILETSNKSAVVVSNTMRKFKKFKNQLLDERHLSPSLRSSKMANESSEEISNNTMILAINNEGANNRFLSSYYPKGKEEALLDKLVSPRMKMTSDKAKWYRPKQTKPVKTQHSKLRDTKLRKSEDSSNTDARMHNASVDLEAVLNPRGSANQSQRPSWKEKDLGKDFQRTARNAEKSFEARGMTS